MKPKKLVVISHTEHYLNAAQTIVGWGSTINEINFLADYWDEVVHVGCLYKSKADKSALPYTKNNIRFVAIPPYGGKTIFDKIRIIFKVPSIIITVIKSLKGATEVQLRLPTSMGVFLLPIFSFLLPRKFVFWVKYAGNWSQVNPPLSYKIQRWWLKNNLAKCKVTINGFWENQSNHCLSFENPCLTDEDILTGKQIVSNKNFSHKFTLCFIGRLDEAKGVDVILESLQKIDLDTIEKIHFIGDSEKRSFYEKEAHFLGNKVVFHGFEKKKRVHQILAASHFLLLPSKSEGFPKVIAEAACYGTIPIVSNVGSISHYIDTSNGFIWDKNSTKSFDEIINFAVTENIPLLSEKSKQLSILAEKFTFNSYLNNLNQKILQQ